VARVRGSAPLGCARLGCLVAWFGCQRFALPSTTRLLEAVCSVQPGLAILGRGNYGALMELLGMGGWVLSAATALMPAPVRCLLT